MCVWIKKIKINRLIKKIRVMQNSRLHNAVGDDVMARERHLCHRLASLCSSLKGKKNYPFAHVMYLAALRASSMLDDSTAQYLLGQCLLNEAKFREQMQRDGVLASENNNTQMLDLYREAHAYLLAADKLQHIQAKRLRGLCYINAWGVLEDKDTGFQLIVESIDAENSWARVPQIFKEMGLNKPEFFSALTQRATNRSQHSILK